MIQNSESILFYEGPYYLLSNFSAHKIVYKEEEYMTCEHAYQVEKFEDNVTRQKIKNAPSAFLAREYGQEKNGRNPFFDKLSVMRSIMKEKVDQHADVRLALLATRDKVIVKNHPEDDYWGTGADGLGSNKMGEIWMDIRRELMINQ